MPAATVAVPVPRVHAASVSNVKPVDGAALSVSATAEPAVATLLNASCSCTVSTVEQAPAAEVRAGVVKTIFDGAAAMRVTFWFAAVRPAAAAVTATTFAVVPFTQKLTLLAPLGIVTLGVE